MARSPVRFLALLRTCAVAAAVLALVDPHLRVVVQSRSVVILIDVSDSMGQDGRARAREAGLGILSAMGKKDRAAVALFAGDPALVAALSSPDKAATALSATHLSAPDPRSTDLEAALALARTILMDAPGERLVALVSDGRSTAGPAPDPDGLSTSGIRLLAVPIGTSPAQSGNLQLALPDSARPGESLAGTARIGAQIPGRYELIIRTDGRESATVPIESDGNAVSLPFAVEAGTGPYSRIDAILRATDGREADSASALVKLGGAGLALVAAGYGTSPIPDALAAQGIPARNMAPGSLPPTAQEYASVSCVILDDVPASSIPVGSLSALDAYVSGGGGLLIVGGSSSLGRGGYYDSPLERLLPVDTDLRKRLLFTRARLLFIIDASGSMSETVGNTAKQLAAMRAVAAALGELNPQDEVGILSFDSVPRWVHRFAPATDGEMAVASLSSMYQGGGTDIEGAVLEALRAFGPPGPTKRHAILLSDGFSARYDPAALAQRLNAASVSLSAIAVGEDVNEDELRALAEGSGGSYYRAELDALPLVTSAEAASLSRDLIIEGRVDIQPEADSDFGTRLASGAPPIQGYVLVRARSLATVHLNARLGENEADPLLIEWRYGAGKVAVFASDSGNRWLAPWSGRPVYNRIWASMVRRIEKPTADSGLRARTFAEDGRARIVAEALTSDGSLASGLRIIGTGSDGQSFVLAETAPGRYEARADPGKGLSVFDLRVEGGGDSDTPDTYMHTMAWAWTPASIESPEAGRDDETLARLASQTGGALLSSSGVQLPALRGGTASLSLRWELSSLALILFIAELLKRSVLHGRVGAARASISSWISARRADADALETPLSRR